MFHVKHLYVSNLFFFAYGKLWATMPRKALHDEDSNYTKHFYLYSS